MLPWQREFLATCLLFRNSCYWDNVIGEFRCHIVTKPAKLNTGLDAQLCRISSVRSHLKTKNTSLYLPHVGIPFTSRHNM